MKRIVLFIFLLSVGAITLLAQDAPIAKEGVEDLRNWDFDEESIISLNGAWEFYWEKLYSPEDFKENIKKTNYINVPYVWNSGKNLEQIKYPSFGYATYKVQVLLPNENEGYSINIKKIYSAYKIWINGVLCFEAGKVAKSKQKYEAGLSNFDGLINNQTKLPLNDTLEIVIQISNYSSSINPGLRNSVFIGKRKSVVKKQTQNFIIGFFAIGVFLIMGISYMFFFIFRKENKPALYFSLMTFSIALRTLFNQDILENFFNNFYITNIIDYGSVALFGVFLSLYFYSLLKKEFGKIMNLIFVVIGLLLVFISFFPLVVIEFFYYLYFLIVFIPTFYIIFVVIPKTYKNGSNEFFWAFLGMFFLLLTTVGDLLSLKGFIDFPLTTTYGFILFTIFQSMYLAKKYSYLLKNNEQLNIELTYKNENLEKIIEERTSVINQQKVDLEEQNEELLQVSDEVRAQNEEMKSITDELAYKTDYLQKQTNALKKAQKEISFKKNKIEESIHYAKRIQNAILPKFDEYLDFFESFIIFLPKDIVSGDFYWTSISPKNDKEIFVAVSDCTGHGVPGAFMSLIGTTLLNEIINQKLILSPEKILDELNENIKTLLKQNTDEDIDGMDLIICKLNKDSRIVTFAGARRPLFYYNSEKNDTTRFITDRLSIGGMHSDLRNKFSLDQIEFKNNDTLYMISDGFIDQNRADRKKYGTHRFMSKINEIALKPLSEQKEILENIIKTWQNNEIQRDDITIVGIKF